MSERRRWTRRRLLASGAVGATARYGVGQKLQTEARLPFSTLFVNVVGSFVLGLVAFGASEETLLLVGVGACGAFTTFSSFSYETVEALREDTAAGVANATVWARAETPASVRPAAA